MFSCSLGVECQNRPNPSKVAFPYLKYPAPNPLRFVCHAPVSPDVRKYNPFAPLSFTPCSQDESIALPSFHSHKPSWSGCCLLPDFVPVSSCCCLFLGKIFQSLAQASKCCVWYQRFVFSFYTWFVLSFCFKLIDQWTCLQCNNFLLNAIFSNLSFVDFHPPPYR